MIIEIVGVDVEQVNNGQRSYGVANVTYNKDGKRQARKVMSFTNQEVFSFLKDLSSFPATVDVELEKDGKGYWQWKGVQMGKPGAAAAGPQRAGNWETPEERAARQVMIVRQSSLSTAVSYLESQKAKADPSAVIELAKQFEAYVMEKGE